VDGASFAQRFTRRGDVTHRGVITEYDAPDDDTASAARNIGRANINASVPALPAQTTSMRRAPAMPRETVATAISTSRMMMIQRMTSTPVPRSWNSSAIAPASNNTRSAVGSRILPSSLPWSKCRAM
jgi:hypothetical protein